MALANIAVVLSRWGYRVLMIDWDLEAPGLEFYFSDFIKTTRIARSNGIVELLEQAAKGNQSLVNEWTSLRHEISLSVDSVPLAFIPAGNRDESYFKRLRAIDLEKFYADFKGGEVIEHLYKEWKESFDFVLIDSRAGVTDIGGLCTVQLPDLLVVFSTPISQSVRGALNVVRRIQLARRNLPLDRFALPILPILSRIDLTEEYQEARKSLQSFSRVFSSLLSSYVPKEWTNTDRINFTEATKIPYISFFSYKEKLAVLEEGTRDPAGLGYSYESLSSVIANNLLDLEIFLKSRSEYIEKAQVRAVASQSSQRKQAYRTARVFISYAEEDEKTATWLSNQCKQAGLDVFYFGDPSLRGSSVFERIESEINRSDYFLALLSNKYLLSKWCDLEINLAVKLSQLHRKEKDANIILLRIEKGADADLRPPLSLYRHIDLAQGNSEKKINDLIRSFSKGITGLITKRIRFIDREFELEQLLSGTRGARGSSLHLIIAPPGFGKTFLLHQIGYSLLKSSDTEWIQNYVDLKRENLESRHNLRALLSKYFNIGGAQISLEKQAAAQILRSRKHWLLQLDSAELLDDKAARDFREFVAEMQSLVSDTNIKSKSAPSFIFMTASRILVDSFKGISPAPRFNIMHLTPFTEQVIAEALQQIGEVRRSNMHPSELVDLSRKLYAYSQGIPSLVAQDIKIVSESTHTNLSDESFEKSWAESAHGFINHLLSDFAVSFHIIEFDDIKKLLLSLSAFRLIVPQLIEHILEKRNITAYSNIRSISNALTQSYFFAPLSDIYQNMHPPIRRLMFHYAYPLISDKIKAHHESFAFFNKWLPKISGTDRIRFFIECLWHITEIERLSFSPKAKENILSFLRNSPDILLTDQFMNNKDTAQFITSILSDDIELLNSLERIQIGFSEQLLGVLNSSSS